MNSMLNITIRVAANQARKEIAAVERDLRRVNTGGGGGATAGAAATRGLAGLASQYGITNKAAIGMAQGVDRGWSSLKNFSAGLPATIGRMESLGKNMQWVGRQLSFNFTLPLVLAGSAAMRWAMDNEAAMTRVRKVYGDGTKSTQEYNKEVDALGKTFEMLSTRFGINQAAVINIAGDWAQVGAQGEALGRVVRSTLEAMTLGEIDATQATEGLITMMAAYSLRAVPQAGQKTSELEMAIAKLNAVENQTQIDMGGLIGVMQRSASAAEAAGISYEYLAAMAAGLVPTAGTAAQAGNGLRTMIARLVRPTVETTNALKNLGVVTKSNDFFKQDVHTRLVNISKAFMNMSEAQQLVLHAQIAGTWQFNKFAALMRDMQDPMGNYNRALQAMGIEQNSAGRSMDVMKTKQEELARVLSSNPKKFDILKTSIQNSLAKAILPLLPAIQTVLIMITQMANAFASMDPKTQKFILFGLMFLAITGPIVQLMGAWILLISQLGKGAFKLGKGLAWVGRNMASMAQSIWDLLARLLFQQGAVSGAWTAGEGQRVAATTAANAAIAGSTSGTMGALGAAQVRTAAITGVAWNQAAIASSTGWGSAVAAIGGSQLALGPATGRVAAGMAAAHTAAAGTVGTTWIVANAALVSVTTIAGNQIVRTWVGTSGGIIAAMTPAMGAIAALQAGPAAAAVPAAITTGAAWKAAAIEVVAVETTAMGTVASLQAAPVAPAVASAAATAGAWIMAFWPIVAVVAAVAAAVILILKTDIEEPVWRVLKSIGRGIWALPGVFARALSALARAVARVVQTVVRWLSYLNPFQRHSPSLVDNVRAGVSTILDEYDRLRGIAPIIRDAARAHDAFNNAVASSGNSPKQRERSEQRAIISEQAPSVLPEFDQMSVQVDRLEATLPRLRDEIQAQATVVARWEAELKSVDQELKFHQKILSDLEKQLDGLADGLAEAREELDALGNTDLPGMRAMSDAIFENEMAQKRLRLEMIRLEEAGGSIDDLRQKMAALNGEIELLRSEREELRLAGAGSDVLKEYDDQIAALEQQKKGLHAQGEEIEKIQKKLDELDRQAEILNLEQSINFDPQLRQIDQMINGLNEMPFDEIVARIGEQQAKMRELQPQYDAVAVLVEAERATVEQIQAHRDAINDQLDLEQEKLTGLESAYSDIEAMIRAMTSDMEAFVAASKEAAEAAGAFDPFDAAAGGDFEEVSGLGGLGAGGDLGDIEAMNAELEKELEAMFEGIGDPFAGIKEKFNGFTSFIGEWGKLAGPIIGGILLAVFTPIGWPALVIGLLVGVIWQWGPEIWAAIKWVFGQAVEIGGQVFSTIGSVLSTIWESVIMPVVRFMATLFTDVLVPAFQKVADIAVWAWQNVIYPAIQLAWDIIKPILEALWGFFNDWIIPIITLLATIFEIQFRLIWFAVTHAWDIIKVILQALWDFITNVVAPVIKWLWENIVQPVFLAIGAFIAFTWTTVIQPILQLLWDFITNVLGPVFMWLWNNIVTPVWNAIGSIIGAAWNGVISPIFDGIKRGIELVGGVFTWLKDHIITPVWNAIGNIISGAWDRVAGILEGGINFFVSAFNLLARGVNTVAGAVGASMRVKEMSPVSLRGGGGGGGGNFGNNGSKSGWHASGTAAISPYNLNELGPFVTNGARAIVGEGSKTHPEFVIPTDPKFRTRAAALYGMLGQKLGNVPKFAAGGIPNPVAAVGNAIGGAVDVAKKFWDIISKVGGVIGGIGSDIVRAVANKIKSLVVDWGRKQLEKIPGVGTAVKVVGGAVGAAKSGWNSTFGRLPGLEAGGMLDYNNIPALAAGGIIRRQSGGVLMRVAEGRNDERVQVTPLRDGDGGGDTHYHFYGDLEFPNITSADDAEKFIRNLESLV